MTQTLINKSNSKLMENLVLKTCPIFHPNNNNASAVLKKIIYSIQIQANALHVKMELNTFRISLNVWNLNQHILKIIKMLRIFGQKTKKRIRKPTKLIKENNVLDLNLILPVKIAQFVILMKYLIQHLRSVLNAQMELLMIQTYIFARKIYRKYIFPAM